MVNIAELEVKNVTSDFKQFLLSEIYDSYGSIIFDMHIVK